VSGLFAGARANSSSWFEIEYRSLRSPVGGGSGISSTKDAMKRSRGILVGVSEMRYSSVRNTLYCSK
jgi:hypothetical protein